MELILKELLKNNLIKKEDEEKVKDILIETVPKQIMKNDVLHVVEIENMQKEVNEEIIKDAVTTALDIMDYSDYNYQLSVILEEEIKYYKQFNE